MSVQANAQRSEHPIWVDPCLLGPAENTAQFIQIPQRALLLLQPTRMLRAASRLQLAFVLKSISAHQQPSTIVELSAGYHPGRAPKPGASSLQSESSKPWFAALSQ